jgi:hypothetical protein
MKVRHILPRLPAGLTLVSQEHPHILDLPVGMPMGMPMMNMGSMIMQMLEPPNGKHWIRIYGMCMAQVRDLIFMFFPFCSIILTLLLYS